MCIRDRGGSRTFSPTASASSSRPTWVPARPPASPAKPRSASVPPHPSRERIQERSFSFGNYLHSTSDWEHTLRKGSKAPQDGQGSTTGNRERAPGKGLKRQGRGIAVNRDSTDLPQTASACRASGAAFASTGATSSRRLDPEHRARVDLLSLVTTSATALPDGAAA